MKTRDGRSRCCYYWWSCEWLDGRPTWPGERQGFPNFPPQALTRLPWPPPDPPKVIIGVSVLSTHRLSSCRPSPTIADEPLTTLCSFRSSTSGAAVWPRYLCRASKQNTPFLESTQPATHLIHSKPYIQVSSWRSRNGSQSLVDVKRTDP